MTTLRLSTYSMPAADLGPDNPLPVLRGERELHALEPGSNVPQAMVDSLTWGHPPNILPYTRQDGYSRERRPRDFRVAVLENEILRATFLPELGGRLWSLVGQAAGRELLYVNPVFQPANWLCATRGSAAASSGTWASSGTRPLTCKPALRRPRRRGRSACPPCGCTSGSESAAHRTRSTRGCRRNLRFLFVRVRGLNPHARTIRRSTGGRTWPVPEAPRRLAR